jgi:CSLREA domain-containing protein
MISRLLRGFGPTLTSMVLVVGLLAPITSGTAVTEGETFIVDSTLDDHDASGDCQCRTAGGVCTLRAAIEEANACTGGQTIRFGGPWSITPATTLPAITDDGTVIDGSDWWMVGSGLGFPAVQLDGNSGAFNGLEITGANCAVYGMVVTGFGHRGVYIHGGAHDNTIGGTGTHQRNVISGNGEDGVLIEGATTTTNTVTSNYIGTNPEGTDVPWGTVDWSNGHHGVSVWYGASNVITGNLVADNGWSGVATDYVNSGQISHNRIGMAVGGEPLGNGYHGIHIAHGSTPVASYNEIAFNVRGIHIDGGSDPWIYHNTIYSNTASAFTPPHGGGIMVTGSGTHGLINYNDILSNTARFGGGIAVEDGASPAIHYNTIQANWAYTTGSTTLGGGGIYVHQASAGIEHNQILSNTATGDSSAYPFPSGGGIYLESVTSVTVEDNEIRGNLVDGNAGGGGGIYIWDGDNVRILHNTVIDNRSYTWAVDGGGIEINNDPATSQATIDRNWIAGNYGSGGAVYLFDSGHVTLTNNVIVRNWTNGLHVHTSTVGIMAAHNTIAHNSRSGIKLEGAHLELYNTIVVSNTNYGAEVIGAWTLTQTRNDVWGNVQGECNETWVTFYMQEPPLFFDATADQYALRAGSPCIDVGDPAHTSPDSYNGLSRPQGAGPDIGAYEMTLTYLPLVLRDS